jgi:N-acetylmuramoyl-L-alanine amidase
MHWGKTGRSRLGSYGAGGTPTVRCPWTILVNPPVGISRFLFSCNPPQDAHGLRMNFLVTFRGWFLVLLIAFFGLGSGRKPAAQTPVPPALSGPVTVKSFAKDYGFTQVTVEKDHVLLKGNVHELQLTKDSRKAILNGSIVWLNDAMVVRNRLWVLSQVDVEKTLKPVLRPAEALSGNGFKRIVLDAGHGAEDSGAISPTGLTEKVVVLDITQRVRKHLLASGYEVFMTRHNDTFLELEERSRRTKAWNADVFVSIHANSGPKTAVGTETFALALPGYASTNQSPGSVIPKLAETGNAHDKANMALAYALHHSLRTHNTLIDRGVRRARFSVLKHAPCPAALVEVGFLTHAKEGAKLAKADHREEIAYSIALGIENYMRGVKLAAVEMETSDSKQD